LIPTPFAAAFTAAHSPRGEEIPSLRAQAMVAVGVMRRKLGRIPDSSRAAAWRDFLRFFPLFFPELPDFFFLPCLSLSLAGGVALQKKEKNQLLTAVTGIRE